MMGFLYIFSFFYLPFPRLHKASRQKLALAFLTLTGNWMVSSSGLVALENIYEKRMLKVGFEVLLL